MCLARGSGENNPLVASFREVRGEGGAFVTRRRLLVAVARRIAPRQAKACRHRPPGQARVFVATEAVASDRHKGRARPNLSFKLVLSGDLHTACRAM